MKRVRTGYNAAALALYLNEAQRKYGIEQGSPDVEVRPVTHMPEPEIEPIPFAMDGTSARNARRLAKKKRK